MHLPPTPHPPQQHCAGRERWKDSLSPFTRPKGRLIYRTRVLRCRFPGISSFFEKLEELERDLLGDFVPGTWKGTYFTAAIKSIDFQMYRELEVY